MKGPLMQRNFPRTLLIVFVLAICSTSLHAKPRKSIADAISQLQPNPEIAAFFIEEATRARVGDIIIVSNGGDYGSTTWRSDNQRSVITINIGIRGGNSPTNIAHEISHAAVFRRSCFNHGAKWLTYHVEIAQRFEARFPGVPWSGKRPTSNVAGKAARYKGEKC